MACKEEMSPEDKRIFKAWDTQTKLCDKIKKYRDTNKTSTEGTWSQLQEMIAKFMTPRSCEKNRFLFRGVSDCTRRLAHGLLRGGLKPSMSSTELRYEIEKAQLLEFRQRAPFYLQGQRVPKDGDIVEWWAIMQHYGAATRLLDWSASPYVALYFAAKNQPDKDGALWMLDFAGAAHDRLKNKGYSLSSPIIWPYQKQSSALCTDLGELIYFFPARFDESRFRAQRSWFSLCALAETYHDDAITKLCPKEKDKPWDKKWFARIVIPKEMKPKILRKLWLMNIHEETLFPGLQGLGGLCNSFTSMLQPEDEPDGSQLHFNYENGLLSAFQQQMNQ